MQVVVGMSDMRVSNDTKDVLITYSLGSCIGIAVHDPMAGVGGILHFMLPDSSLDRAKALKNPFIFADTGIPALFQAHLRSWHGEASFFGETCIPGH